MYIYKNVYIYLYVCIYVSYLLRYKLSTLKSFCQAFKYIRVFFPNFSWLSYDHNAIQQVFLFNKQLIVFKVAKKWINPFLVLDLSHANITIGIICHQVLFSFVWDWEDRTLSTFCWLIRGVRSNIFQIFWKGWLKIFWHFGRSPWFMYPMLTLYSSVLVSFLAVIFSWLVNVFFVYGVLHNPMMVRHHVVACVKPPFTGLNYNLLQFVFC